MSRPGQLKCLTSCSMYVLSTHILDRTGLSPIKVITFVLQNKRKKKKLIFNSQLNSCLKNVVGYSVELAHNSIKSSLKTTA